MSPQFLDRAGILISTLCLIHCMALPVIALLVPTAAAVFAFNETLVHLILLGCALPISFYAFRHGYQHHQDVLIVLLGVTGLVFLVLGVTHIFGEDWELILTVPGAILLFMAHLRNWRYHRGHVHTHDAEHHEHHEHQGDPQRPDQKQTDSVIQ